MALVPAPSVVHVLTLPGQGLGAPPRLLSARVAQGGRGIIGSPDLFPRPGLAASKPGRGSPASLATRRHLPSPSLDNERAMTYAVAFRSQTDALFTRDMLDCSKPVRATVDCWNGPPGATGESAETARTWGYAARAWLPVLSTRIPLVQSGVVQACSVEQYHLRELVGRSSLWNVGVLLLDAHDSSAAEVEHGESLWQFSARAMPAEAARINAGSFSTEQAYRLTLHMLRCSQGGARGQDNAR